MSYSNQNPAWDRMHKGKHDDRIQWEAQHAAELQKQDPGLSRSDALLQAAAAYDREQAKPYAKSSAGPVLHPIGTKVMITDASLQNIVNGNRGIRHFPDDSYLAVARDLHAKQLVGEVTQLFPPGYEVNVTFSDGRILQVKDHWVEVVEAAPAADTSPSP